MKKIFIVSAPSGAGKTTLVQTVIKNCASSISLHRVVTYTTRVSRNNEQEGIDYFFIDALRFEQLIQEGFFIEWSIAYGNYYGTPTNFWGQAPQAVGFIFIVDRLGATYIKQAHPQGVTIFIEVADLMVLQERLKHRGNISPQDLAFRLALAQKELELERQTRWHDYRLLNEDLGRATKDFEEIIKKEVSFVIKNKEFLREI
jgi:guanylate kinase